MPDPFFDAGPRTFPGDPNPPPKAPDAPAVSTSSAPTSSAGTGALPPEAQQGAPGRPSDGSQPTYSVVQAPDGSRGVFEWGKDGPQRVGDVSVADADQVLNAASGYDESSKTWDNVPPDIAKSLMGGRLGFPERVARAWNGGEAGVVRDLSFARVMNGEIDGDKVAEDAHPDLVKARLDSDPSVAWQGGFGKTLAAWAGHPIAAAEEGAVNLAGMAPMMKDLLLNGAAPGALEGGVAGGGAALAAGAVAGPLAPEAAAAVMTKGVQVGMTYGTMRRAYDLFGGQFAAQMHDQGYDDEAIRKYAPVAGLVNAALTGAQFDLMTPSMQAATIKKVVGSGAVREAIAGALFKFGGRTAGFTALGDAQQLVNDYVGNMAAVAEKNPAALKPGSEVLKDLSQTTLSSMLTGGVLAGATGSLEAAAGLRRPSQARLEGQGLDLAHGKPTYVDGGGPPAPGGPSVGGRQSPLASSEAGLPQSLRPVDSSASSVPGTGEPVKTYEETLKYRQSGGEKTPAETVERMKGEAKGMQEVLDVDRSPNAKFIEDSLARHQADIATLEKGPEPQFFKPSEIDLEGQPADRRGGDEARKQIVGEKNEQIVRGNQIFSQFEREVPDEGERAAITRYIDMGGDREKLRAAAADELLPAEGREPLPAESRAEYARALNLSPKALEWAKRLQTFYEQAHEEGQARGTLDSARENYINRLYLPEEEEPLNPGTKANALRRTTAHSFERYYETLYDAETSGKRLASTDAAQLARIYNEEMAGVNANRAGLDNLAENGLGAWKQKAPDGWVKVGDLEKRAPIKDKIGNPVLGEDGNQLISKSHFYAPKGLAEGLKPLVDLDWTKKIPLLKSALDFQNAVKSGLLSMSLFHDVTILSQAVNQHAIGTLLHGTSLDDLMSEDTFRNSEQWGVRHGLITHEVLANIDIVRSLTKEPGIADAIKEMPGMKQVLAANDAHTYFLFGKLSRYLKVMDFARQAADWAGKNPDAVSTVEHTAALRDIAKQVNAAYGGQNWEAMGMTKSNVSLMRLAFLAPDWLVSNAQMAKMALGDLGVAGQRSRLHFATGMALGVVATEGLNNLFTGHFTDENKKGHKLEVEVAPDVYVSLFRGASGEAVKLGSMMAESEGGASVGALRYANSKIAPIPRAAVTLTGVAADHRFPNYYGRPIIPKGAGTVRGTYELLKALLEQTSPVPFSGSALLHYFSSGRPTVAGAAAVGSGIGRYSRPPKHRGD